MTLRNIFRGLCIASGVVVGALAGRGKRPAQSACPAGFVPCSKADSSVAPKSSSMRSDYFSITRTRSSQTKPKWVLQGFGRFECFLLFDTWREAMDQANFRIETLAAGELIQLSH